MDTVKLIAIIKLNDIQNKDLITKPLCIASYRKINLSILFIAEKTKLYVAHYNLKVELHNIPKQTPHQIASNIPEKSASANHVVGKKWDRKKGKCVHHAFKTATYNPRPNIL